MPKLLPHEIDCLRRIARGDANGDAPCTDQTLRHLAEMALVERVPTQCLPLEMPRTALRLTPAGHAVLQSG